MSRYEQFKKEFHDCPELLKVLEEAKENKVIDEELKILNPLNCSFLNSKVLDNEMAKIMNSKQNV